MLSRLRSVKIPKIWLDPSESWHGPVCQLSLITREGASWCGGLSTMEIIQGPWRFTKDLQAYGQAEIKAKRDEAWGDEVEMVRQGCQVGRAYYRRAGFWEGLEEPEKFFTKREDLELEFILSFSGGWGVLFPWEEMAEEELECWCERLDYIKATCDKYGFPKRDKQNEESG